MVVVVGVVAPRSDGGLTGGNTQTSKTGRRSLTEIVAGQWQAYPHGLYPQSHSARLVQCEYPRGSL